MKHYHAHPRYVASRRTCGYFFAKRHGVMILLNLLAELEEGDISAC